MISTNHKNLIYVYISSHSHEITWNNTIANDLIRNHMILEKNNNRIEYTVAMRFILILESYNMWSQQVLAGRISCVCTMYSLSKYSNLYKPTWTLTIPSWHEKWTSKYDPHLTEYKILRRHGKYDIISHHMKSYHISFVNHI